MDNTKLDETKALIEKYLEKWVTPLGLGWWKIDMIYYDDPGEIVDKFKSEDDGYLVLAKVFAKWQYMEATIYINLPGWADLEEEKIEKAIVHELCHILVNEMREDDILHEERVVSTLQRAFMWVIDAGRDEGMEAVK
jgi:hypothetical protein